MFIRTGVKAAAANLRWAFSTAASMAVIEMKNRYGKVRRSIVTACSYDSPPSSANPGGAQPHEERRKYHTDQRHQGHDRAQGAHDPAQQVPQLFLVVSHLHALRVNRHEALRQRPLGEEMPEQARNPEGDDEGVHDHAGADEPRERDLARQAQHPGHGRKPRHQRPGPQQSFLLDVVHPSRQFNGGCGGHEVCPCWQSRAVSRAPCSASRRTRGRPRSRRVPWPA